MPPRRVVAALFLLVCSVGARAASPESVERLLQVMKVQMQIETVYAQAMPVMQNAMRQAISAQGGSAEAQRVFDIVTPRVNAIVAEELGWAKLKPDFVAIYAETLTQEEVDGLIVFYEGPIGSALIDKTPQLTQRSMQLMQQRMGPLMQHVMQVTREEAEKELGRGGQKR
jgi:uncharacterized protein